MITGRFQFFAIAAVILFFVLLFWLLKKNRLSLRYTLLWMLSGVIMLILAVFPRLLDSFARMIGIYSSVNALFAVILFCGLMLMISFTSVRSATTTRRCTRSSAQIRDTIPSMTFL